MAGHITSLGGTACGSVGTSPCLLQSHVPVPVLSLPLSRCRLTTLLGDIPAGGLRQRQRVQPVRGLGEWSGGRGGLELAGRGVPGLTMPLGQLGGQPAVASCGVLPSALAPCAPRLTGSSMPEPPTFPPHARLCRAPSTGAASRSTTMRWWGPSACPSTTPGRPMESPTKFSRAPSPSCGALGGLVAVPRRAPCCCRLLKASTAQLLCCFCWLCAAPHQLYTHWQPTHPLSPLSPLRPPCSTGAACVGGMCTATISTTCGASWPPTTGPPPGCS